MKDLYVKIRNVKNEIGKISKDTSNDFYKSKYFDINKLLEALEPLLFKNDLMVLQPVIDGAVTTQLICLKTGDMITSSIKITGLNMDKADPQKVGSEITYYRRYGLVSLLSLQAEDDDANLASGKVSSAGAADKKEEDVRPWLDQKGFEYLMTCNDVEQIKTAFKKRRMKKVFRNSLEGIVNELEAV